MPTVKVKIKPEIDTTGTGGDGGRGGAFGGIAASLGGIAGKLGPLAAIAGTVLSFGPLLRTLKQIGLTLREFLRPISEVVQILLMPVLNLLRPLLQIFRGIIAPFRRAALRLSGEASRAAAQGDPSRSLELSGLAAGVLLKPFVDLFLDIQGQLLQVVVTALGAVAKVISASIIGVAQLVVKFIPGLGPKVAEKLEALRTNAFIFLDDTVAAVNNLVQGSIDTIKNNMNAALEEAAAEIGVQIELPQIDVSPIDDFVSAMEDAAIGFTERLGKTPEQIAAIQESLENLDLDTVQEKIANLSPADGFGTEVDISRVSATPTDGKGGFFGNFLTNLKESFNGLFGGDGPLTTIFLSAEVAIQAAGRVFLGAFGPAGTVVTAATTTFDIMQKTTLDFTSKAPPEYITAMGDMKNETNSYAEDMVKAGDDIASAARKVASALEELRDARRRG